MSSPAAEHEFRDLRQRFGEVATGLAAHAAIPVAVTPTLLNFIRTAFFLDPPDALPYDTEADLLLSPAFRSIGSDLYEIDPGLRDLLLAELDVRYGPDRARHVAELLYDYGVQGAPWADSPRLDAAQQLTAYSFVDPDGAREALKQSATAGVDRGLDRTWHVAMEQRLERAADAAPSRFLDRAVEHARHDRWSDFVAEVDGAVERFPLDRAAAATRALLRFGSQLPETRDSYLRYVMERLRELVKDLERQSPVYRYQFETLLSESLDQRTSVDEQWQALRRIESLLELLEGPGQPPPAHKASWAVLDDPSLADPRDPKTLLIIDMLSESIYRRDETIAFLEAVGLKPRLYPPGTAKLTWTAAVQDAARQGKLPILIDRIVDVYPSFGRELERRLQSVPPPPPPSADLDGLSDEQIGLLRRTLTTLGDLMDTSAELEGTVPLAADLAKTSAQLRRSLNQAKNQLLVLEREISVMTWPHNDWAIDFSAARAQAQRDLQAVEEWLYRPTASRHSVTSERDRQFRQSVAKLQRLLKERYPSLFTRREVAGLAAKPDDHVDGFSWEASLNRAHSALEGGNTEASSALLQAVADASRMAEHCHDELVRRGPMPLPQNTFEDWNRFLMTLYNDAWKLYPRYLVKSGEGHLQMIFEAVRDAALAALLELQDMNAAEPSQKARAAVVVKLSKLVAELEAAKAVLEHS